MKYKICLIAHYGEDYLDYRLSFLKYLRKFGRDSFAIVPRDVYFNEINKTEFPVYFYKYSRSWKFFFDIIKTYSFFKKTLIKEKPNLVFTYKFFPNLLGIYVADKVGVKLKVATVAGLGFLENRKKYILIRIVFRIYMKVLTKADYIIVQNRDDKILFEKYHSINKVVLTNGSGVNKDMFLNIDHLPSDFKHKDLREINFLFCSRIIKEKGILELIDAFKSLLSQKQNLRLTIAGWFDNKNIEKKVLESIKGCEAISFLGYAKDVQKIILQSDCVVLPSYYPEGVPRSLTESLALSRPVITTNHKGCKETCIDGVNGYLVKPRDVSDLQEKLLSFVNLNKKEIDNMKSASLELFNNKFEEKKVFKTIVDKIFDK
jgi:glycosyltransferase involved in cell wall biosynthesis